jgi:hypothetical protein
VDHDSGRALGDILIEQPDGARLSIAGGGRLPATPTVSRASIQAACAGSATIGLSQEARAGLPATGHGEQGGAFNDFFAMLAGAPIPIWMEGSIAYSAGYPR